MVSRERVELLNSNNGSSLYVMLLTVLVQRGEDLATAEDYLVEYVIYTCGCCVLRIIEYRLKRG